MDEDDVFLKRVRDLMQTARNAAEEAASYAEMITNKKKREEAERELETM